MKSDHPRVGWAFWFAGLGVVAIGSYNPAAADETGRSLAGIPTKKEAAPTPPTLQFGLNIDFYYARNFNQPRPLTGITNAATQDAMIPTPQNNLRFYDWYHNQIGLNLAELTLQANGKEVSAHVDFDFGQMADMNAQVPTPATTGGPTSAVVDEVSKHLGQAFLSYSPSFAPGLVIEAGKMPTHVGLELIKSKDNWNYTRGALFSFGGPFWHVGTHLGYAVTPEHFWVSAFLYQGWNTIYETNSTPTFGAQLKWQPSTRFTWLYNYIGGPEQTGNDAAWKQVHETNMSFQLADTFSMALDILLGMEKGVAITSRNNFYTDAMWAGVAVLAKWQASKDFFIAPRFEFYRDFQGYTLGGDTQNLFTYTITTALRVADGLEARLEGRMDVSTFTRRFNLSDGTTGPVQSTMLLSALYSM